MRNPSGFHTLTFYNIIIVGPHIALIGMDKQ